MLSTVLPVIIVLVLLSFFAVACILLIRKNYLLAALFFILAMVSAWGTQNVDLLKSITISFNPKKGVYSFKIDYYKILDPTQSPEPITISGLSQKEIEEKITGAIQSVPVSFDFLEINPAKGIIGGLMKIRVNNHVNHVVKNLTLRWCINDGFGIINPPSEVWRLENRLEPHYDLEPRRGLLLEYGPHISPSAPSEYVAGKKTLRLKFYVTYKIPDLDPDNEYYDFFESHLTPELEFDVDRRDEGKFTGQDLFKEKCIKR